MARSATVVALLCLFALVCCTSVAALSPIGLNLPRLDVQAPHFGGAWAAASSGIFTNLFKHATPFESQSRGKNCKTCAWGWGRGEAIWPLRPDGYPPEIKVFESWNEYCAMAKVGLGQAYYAAGQYVLLYNGVGKVTVSGDAAVTADAPNRLELQITPKDGFYVRIVETNVTNPVTNISIVPAAAEGNFLAKPYQSGFLDLVRGFKVLRFTMWQRIWGDANNPQMKRTLAERSTQATQSYQMKDGVSVEDMVALCNEVGADPWFSLPVAVDDTDAYANNMARYVADNLATERSVYIEFGKGAPGWMTTDLATNTLRLARIWKAAFAAAPSRVVVTVTYEYPSWIPYFFNTFGANTDKVDAVATSGVYGPRAWNTNRPCYYRFNEVGFTHDPQNSNITMEKMTSVVRSSVIHADLVHNHWYQRLKASGKRLLGVTGGPDERLQAPWWAARDNYQSVMRCNSWPCSRNLYAPANPRSVTYATAAERDAAAPVLKAQADIEWNIDEMLMKLKLRDPATKDHMLDHLSRWNAMNGDVMMVSLPEAISCSSGSGTAVLPPLECQAGSGIQQTVTPDTNPIWQAVKAFQAGESGALPLSKAWSAEETSTCTTACKYGTCVKETCQCWAGFTGSDCSMQTTRPNQCNKLVGVNLEGVRDWASSWTFVDIMRSARGFLSQNMDGSGGWGNFSGVALNSDGWVSQLYTNQKAGTMMIRDLQAHIPAGTYTMLYDGEGLIDCDMDVVVMRQIEAGRAEIDLKPSTLGNNGLYCTVERTNPTNPVRNIRVLMPGFDARRAAANPFHPRFVKLLENFGVLRFMGWMETNGDALPRTWAERAKVTDRSYAGVNKGGVAVEHMVQLANMVGAAPWFSMPHLANDEYHRQFATIVNDTLRPDVKVYVEWSNEVWHTGFSGGKYAQAEGVRLGMNEEGAKWYGGATNEARLCYYSERTKIMSQIWKEVFGAKADRVVIVAQGQAVWPITSDKVLKCRNATSYIDALAVGPYFGDYDPKRDTSVATYLGSTIYPQITKTMNDYVLPHAQIAAKYGKMLLTYEAGPAIVAGSGDFPVQAHRDPAMYNALNTYLNSLVTSGVKLINHFTHMGRYSAGGSWGLLEWNDQDTKTSPKWQALQDFIATNASTCAPGDDPSLVFDDNTASNGTNSGNSTTPGNPTNTCVDGCSGQGECLDGACYCNTGYSGPTCAVADPTAVYNCGYQCTFGQGTCAKQSLQGTTQTYGCTCNLGFTGIACSLFTCPQSCSYSGTCLDLNVCACYPGFKGDACEIDCGCNGHGMCAADNTCICDAGWKLGANGCEPDCSGCAAGATCIAPGECGCVPGCLNGTCYNGRCECWAGYTGAACDTLVESSMANYKSPVGVEVAGLAYWSTQWVFLDIMKQSSAWMTQNAPDTTILPPWSTWDTQDPLTLRSDGYPEALPAGKIAHKLAVRNVQLKAMPGRYVALYDGEGTLDFGFDAKVSSVAKGRVEFEYRPTANMECHATGAAYCGDNGIWIKVSVTNPANPIHNVRVLPPGFEHVHERQVFHPWFLKALERFKVLRFMSWMDANNDNYLPWEKRTLPSQASQAHGKGGVALEHIVDLCNRLGADAWINVHHRADDDYVRKLATFLKDNLRPDVKVHVEHSNEVWNQAFAQGKYARQKGKELGLSDKDDIAGYMYHGKRSSEIFDIFTEVYGLTEVHRPTRLRFVVATWGFVCSGTWGTGCGFTATNATLSYGNVAQKADVLAIPGYFDCGLGKDPAKEAQMPIEAMLAQCASAEQMNATRTNAVFFKDLAAKFGLRLTTYESGPSIMEGSVIFNGGGTPGAAEKYIAFQRDPRFKGIYEAYLAMFESIGLVSEAAPWMQFVSAGLPSKYGSWGLIEHTGQAPASAPKYLALKGLLDIKQPSGVYTGCLGPQKGAAGLGDNSFFGVPAIMFPRKGAVLVQGVEYNVAWPATHAPANNVSIDLFSDTDCDSATPLATFGPVKPTFAGFEAFAPFSVPSVPAVDTASAQGSRYFLRIQDSITGQRNYSEYFTVQPLQISGAGGCVINPMLPATQPFAVPAPRCSPEYKWNISAMPTGICEVYPAEHDRYPRCRYYRTSTKAGQWTSNGKPVYDCTAQLSPNPSAAALVAGGYAVGPLKPGAACT